MPKQHLNNFFQINAIISHLRVAMLMRIVIINLFQRDDIETRSLRATEVNSEVRFRLKLGGC